jgi:hypothetical protein
MLSPNWRSFVANVDRLVANVTFAKTAVVKLVVAKKVVAKLTGHRSKHLMHVAMTLISEAC